VASVALAAALMGGCNAQSFFDRSELAGRPGAWEGEGRTREPLMVQILDELAPGWEQPDSDFAMAEPPQPTDMETATEDYNIGPGDDILVSITDLVAPSVETVRQIRVSESGRISLPLIGQLNAQGMTEAQLEQTIVQAYRDADIIRDAQVSVQVQIPRGKTFSIFGAVSQPGEYAIVKQDFRLLDALLQARGAVSPYIDEIYIYRQLNDRTAPGVDAGMQPQTGPAQDLLTPRPQQPSPGQRDQQQGQTEEQPEGAAAQPAINEGRYIVVDGKPVLVGGGQAPAQRPAPQPQQQEQQPRPQQASQVGGAGQQAAGTFEFNEPVEPRDYRVIRISLDSLRRGERRYNVAIRPGDFIQVPEPEFGLYFMGGHVGRPGTYQLSGQKTTLTQAVIAAGMLDQLAVASRTDVVRRVGDQQIFVRVDLQKIFNGDEPNFYIQPNDEIRVGTDFWAPYIAALRGAFRATYGFGFLYDRNFGPRNQGRF
jgi:polysaccharide biosynthesis/export protein